MSNFSVTRDGVVLASLAAIGAMGLSLKPADPAIAAERPVACDIEVSRSSGLVGLKAIVNSHDTISGNYRLRVTSSGANSSTIDQSGDFTVSHGTAVVSSVNLGGVGAYTARLSITANGRTTECSRKVGGSL